MKLRRLIGTIAVAVSLGALAAATLAVPLAAQQGRNGQVHIVKDCGAESGVPGSDFCVIETSNLWQLPPGTRIYYDLNPGPTAGPGYFDQNIFVFVNDRQWAVGRCTGPNNIITVGPEGLCTITDGIGALAGFTARIKVTYYPNPAGSGLEFGWDGTYSFNPLSQR